MASSENLTELKEHALPTSTALRRPPDITQAPRDSWANGARQATMTRLAAPPARPCSAPLCLLGQLSRREH
eukprot:3227611-Pyramimonas_sp.AAC.1